MPATIPALARLVGLAAVIVSGCLSGCATTVQFRTPRPAVTPLPSVGRVTVLRFQGWDDLGRLAQETVADRLRASAAVPLAEEDQLLTAGGLPIYLDGDVLNRAVAMEGARRAGIGALLFGEVRLLESDGEPYGTKTIQFGDPRVRAVIDYELIQVATGRPLLAGSVESSERIIEDAPRTPGEVKVLRALVEEAAAAVANRLVPHDEQVEVQLESLVYGSGAGAVRRGNRAAADADWQAAMNHWQQALEQDPGNHAAMYNLALAHEARGEFFRAEQLVRAALASRDADHYREALARIGKASSDARMAMHQRARFRPAAVAFVGYAGEGSLGAGNPGPKWPPFAARDLTPEAPPRLTRLPAPHVAPR